MLMAATQGGAIEDILCTIDSPSTPLYAVRFFADYFCQDF